MSSRFRYRTEVELEPYQRGLRMIDLMLHRIIERMDHAFVANDHETFLMLEQEVDRLGRNKARLTREMRELQAVEDLP